MSDKNVQEEQEKRPTSSCCAASIISSDGFALRCESCGTYAGYGTAASPASPADLRDLVRELVEALKAAEQILKRSPNVSTNDSGRFRNVTTLSVLSEVGVALARAEREIGEGK